MVGSRGSLLLYPCLLQSPSTVYTCISLFLLESLNMCVNFIVNYYDILSGNGLSREDKFHSLKTTILFAIIVTYSKNWTMNKSPLLYKILETYT